MTILIPASGDGTGRGYMELLLKLVASVNTLQFDCGKALPPVEIQAAISKVVHVVAHIIRENEAAASDTIDEEHLAFTCGYS
jgi:hypothetical protein